MLCVYFVCVCVCGGCACMCVYACVCTMAPIYESLCPHQKICLTCLCVFTIMGGLYTGGMFRGEKGEWGGGGGEEGEYLGEGIYQMVWFHISVVVPRMVLFLWCVNGHVPMKRTHLRRIVK